MYRIIMHEKKKNTNNPPNIRIFSSIVPFTPAIRNTKSYSPMLCNLSVCSWFIITELYPCLMGDKYCSQRLYSGMSLRLTTSPPYRRMGIMIRGKSWMATSPVLNSTPTHMPKILPTIPSSTNTTTNSEKRVP